MAAASTAGAHAVAGALGGVVSSAICYPLNTISIKLQVEQKKAGEKRAPSLLECGQRIYAEEGIKGLYAGLESCLIAVALSSAIYYYWYELFKALAEGRGPNKRTLTTGDSLWISVKAGVLNAVCTNPIWVVNNRYITAQKAEGVKNRGLISEALNILRTEGIGALYSGIGPALILVINPIITYTSAERMKLPWTRLTGRAKHSPLDMFLLGAAGKLLATLVTYPYVMVKSRLQKKQEGKEQQGAMEMTLNIIKNEGGVPGLYRGFQSKVAQTVLQTAILFYTKDHMERVTLRLLYLLSKLMSS